MFALTIKGGVAQSLAPDVCKVPTPAGPVPTPFVNIFQCNLADPGTISTKIFIDGALALNAQSKILISNGDEPGVAGGVGSNRFIGPGSFLPTAGSMKVSFEGKPALPMGGQTLHNGDASSNTMGQCPMSSQSKVMVAK
jgi:hypothetical protein